MNREEQNKFKDKHFQWLAKGKRHLHKCTNCGILEGGFAETNKQAYCKHNKITCYLRTLNR